MPHQEKIVYGDENIRIWYAEEESDRKIQGSPRYREETINIYVYDSGVTLQVNPAILESLRNTAQVFLEDWNQTQAFSKD